ncbi:MAG: family 20 glycosylhydrolase [Kiritimatiellae bacterium]|nr:family 20 glycosylhydrolase [Kiritimatiellia bacterium]
MSRFRKLLPAPARIELLGGTCPHSILSAEPVVVRDSTISREGYRLELLPSRVQIAFGDDAGAFYAAQTLAQLRGQSTAVAPLPCLVIDDAPAFPLRGILLDVSRGRLPRPARLKRRLELFAHLKINHVQLYFEHPFRFAFDSDIAGDSSSDAYTPDDLRDLDAHCRSLHIDLVPCFTCFGHLGRILSLPAYRPLAAREFPAPSWEEATWLQRLRGATLNPLHPGVPSLLEALLGEFLPCFSSSSFNLCGDETYDLPDALPPGAPADALGNLYAAHVRRVAAIAARHGKRILLWGDVLHKHPSAIRGLPDNATVLDWAYYPTNDFSKCRDFADANVPFACCPSTRGFGALFPHVCEAAEVVRAQTSAALAHGALGILNTDWGDFGHFALPPASLHGFAHSAALAWNLGSSDPDIDAAFSALLFDASDTSPARCYRLLGASTPAVRYAATWPFPPVHPRAQLPSFPPLPSNSELSDALSSVAEAASLASSFRETSWIDATDIAQLALAPRFLDFSLRLALREKGLPEILDSLEKACIPLWMEESLPRGLLDIHRRAFAPLRALLADS